MTRLLLFSAVLILVGLGLGLGAPSAAHGVAAFARPAAASATFLQAGSAIPAAFAGGGAGRAALPNSTLPGTPGVQCSAETSDPVPAACSTRAAGERCSTAVGDFPGCSAHGASTGTKAYCSTLEGNSACSILTPEIGTGWTWCSTFEDNAGQTLRCSVLHSTVSGLSGCSIEVPASGGSGWCTTTPHFFAGSQVCSVQGPRTQVGACSVVGPSFNMECSTEVPVPLAGGAFNARCSVLNTSRGVCTALKGASQFSCSAFFLGHCSVIGGTQGSYCRVP